MPEVIFHAYIMSAAIMGGCESCPKKQQEVQRTNEQSMVTAKLGGRDGTFAMVLCREHWLEFNANVAEVLGEIAEDLDD